MNSIIDFLSDQLKINLRNIASEEEKNNQFSFYQICKRIYVFRYGNKIDWFFKEVESLAQGQNLKNESEFEAAKRLNIGTITGKHAQKALALKNITADEFIKIRQEFVDIVKKTQFKETQTPFKKLLMQE